VSPFPGNNTFPFNNISTSSTKWYPAEHAVAGNTNLFFQNGDDWVINITYSDNYIATPLTTSMKFTTRNIMNVVNDPNCTVIPQTAKCTYNIDPEDTEYIFPGSGDWMKN
jgi:hypothetical protein